MMSLDRPRIERNGTFENFLGFVILVLSQEDAPQLDIRGRMLGMAPEEVSKHGNGLFWLPDGIIGQSQIIGSCDLVRLRFQALFERGLSCGILALEVFHGSDRVTQNRVVRMFLQECTE